MYKNGFGINNLQWLMYHKTKPNLTNLYILNIYYLVEFGLVWFYGILTVVGYLIPNILYTYILNIYDLAFWGLVRHMNHCRLLNEKSSSYIYIRYTRFVNTFC